MQAWCYKSRVYALFKGGDSRIWAIWKSQYSSVCDQELRRQSPDGARSSPSVAKTNNTSKGLQNFFFFDFTPHVAASWLCSWLTKVEQADAWFSSAHLCNGPLKAGRDT
jgi:hypothetical protein